MANVIYTVKAGDTLSLIARQYNTTYQELARINNIPNPDLIYIGQRISIPVTGGNIPNTSSPSTTGKPIAPTSATPTTSTGVMSTFEMYLGKAGMTVSMLAVMAIIAVLVIPRKDK